MGMALRIGIDLRGLGNSVSGPALSLLFAGAPKLDPRVTYTGASHKTMYDSTGKLTYAPNQLLTWSNTFSNAAWNKSAVSVVQSATTDPYGGNNGWLLKEDTSTSYHTSYNVVGSTSGSFIYWAVVKANTRTWALLDAYAAVDSISYFDLQNGVVGTVGGGSTNAAISALGGGWYIISVKRSSVSGSIQAILGTATGNNSGNYTGDGTSGIYVYSYGVSAVTYETTPRAADQVITTSAAYYGPRVNDYDPVTLVSKGFLIEESRTNSVKDSGNLTTANWLNSGSTTAASSAILAPDGISTMTQLTYSSTTGIQARYQQVTGAVTAGQQVSISVWMRSGTATQVYIGVQGVTSGSNNFSSSLLTLTTTPQRFTFTATVAASDTGLYVVIGGGIGVNATPTLPATGTIYAWGVQLEFGASFATSYIPTAASAVTRAADVASLNGTALTLLQGARSSVVIAAQTANQGGILFAASDGSTGNRFQIGSTFGEYEEGGAANFSLVQNATYPAGIFKAGFARDSAVSSSFSGNGTAAISHAALASPPVITQVQLGGFPGFNLYFNGWFRKLDLYATRLPDATLQSLTAPTAPTITNAFLLENNSDYLLMEDNSSILTLES